MKCQIKNPRRIMFDAQNLLYTLLFGVFYRRIDNIPSTRNPHRTKQTACPNRRSRVTRAYRLLNIFPFPRHQILFHYSRKITWSLVSALEQNKRIAYRWKKEREREMLFFPISRTLMTTPAGSRDNKAAGEMIVEINVPCSALTHFRFRRGSSRCLVCARL